MLEMPTMLTIKETAEKSGYSYNTIRAMCLKDEIVHIRRGRITYVNWDMFVRYLSGEKSPEATHD